MSGNPFSANIKLSEQTMRLGQHGALLGIVALGIHRFNINLKAIPWLSIEVADPTVVPIATIMAAASTLFIVMFYLHYGEELFEFNQKDYEASANSPFVEDNSSPHPSAAELLADLKEAAKEEAFESSRMKKRFGAMKQILFLGIPAVILIFVLKQELFNIVSLL
ncbi:hypothetical protein AB0V79_27145 [Mesorhizobium ciceri]|uniref:hypothetical protein n=1 Tax=Mesorhizobium ciceri TaxID=39645 RepID=UPI0007A95A71|nr:hypothetical protein [Mesorhizobium ciceri]AMY00705.1 hypothetical protein A4R29_15275 [Mesorhizobium ciceri biovar biserrulae]